MKLVIKLGTVAAVIGIIMLAACGSNDLPQQPKPVTSLDISNKVQCMNFTYEDNADWIAKDSGRCAYEKGTELHIVTFTNNQAQDNWYKLASAFGGFYLVGDKWIVQTDSERSVLELAQQSLGGEVK